MDNNINSLANSADNGFILKPATNVESSNEDKVKLSAEKIVVDKDTVVNVSEDLNSEKKLSNEKQVETSEEDINKALDVVSSFMDHSNKQVAFSNDNTSGKTVITITDKDTQEVINQFPSEKIISMADRIQNLNREAENISGLLIDSRV